MKTLRLHHSNTTITRLNQKEIQLLKGGVTSQGDSDEDPHEKNKKGLLEGER